MDIEQGKERGLRLSAGGRCEHEHVRSGKDQRERTGLNDGRLLPSPLGLDRRHQVGVQPSPVRIDLKSLTGGAGGMNGDGLGAVGIPQAGDHRKCPTSGQCNRLDLTKSMAACAYDVQQAVNGQLG